jgi:hypothetical protein
MIMVMICANKIANGSLKLAIIELINSFQ